MFSDRFGRDGGVNNMYPSSSIAASLLARRGGGLGGGLRAEWETVLLLGETKGDLEGLGRRGDGLLGRNSCVAEVFVDRSCSWELIVRFIEETISEAE